MQSLIARLGLRRILWLLGAGWLVATALAWIGSVEYAHSRMKERTEKALEETRQQAELASANLNRRLTEARSITQALSIDPSVVQALERFGPDVLPSPLPQPQRGAVWSADPNLKRLSDRLGVMVKRFGLNTLWLANAAGDTVAEGHANDVNPFIGTNYLDRAYFKAAQQGQLGRQFAIGRATNVYGLYFSAPVVIRGQFVGMVGVGLSVPKLGATIANLDALVTDDLGVIVQSQDRTQLLQTMPGATVAELTPQQRDLRYKRTEFEASAIRALQIEGLPLLYTRTPKGSPIALQSSATDDGSLQVHVVQNLQQTFAVIERERRWWVGLVSLLALMTAALMGGAVRFVTSTQRHTAMLQELNAALARQASTDALTGCANRRSFMEKLALERERSERFQLSFCVLSLDVDFFKRVNDTHGHAAGDQVLRQLVATLQSHLRDVDTLGRIGGEEFCVLLPQTSANGGGALAERLRAAIAASPVAFGSTSIPVTISIGATQWEPGRDLSIDGLLALADEAMYRAKQRGRNRVEWATPIGSPDPQKS